MPTSWLKNKVGSYVWLSLAAILAILAILAMLAWSPGLCENSSKVAQKKPTKPIINLVGFFYLSKV